jgi:hypothetical protein
MYLSEFIKLNFTYCLKLNSAIGEKFINSFQEISLMPNIELINKMFILIIEQACIL